MQPNEIDVVQPRKQDRIWVMGGVHRGLIGRLIGMDGTEGIVKLDHNLDVKIIPHGHLAILRSQGS